MPRLFEPPDVLAETTSAHIPPRVIATPPRSELAGLPCLSVRQPWASLIVGGRKWAENRTWPTRHRGRLGIHVSKSPAAADDVAEAGLSTGEGLPLGALLGWVTLVDVVETARAKVPAADACVAALADGGHPPSEAAAEDGRPFVIETSPFVWVLAEPVRLETPVPARGQTSVWRFGG